MMALSGYEILTQIYESANSVIYRGHRELDRQPVILKVLKQDYPTPEQLTRYKREYEITHFLNLDGVSQAYSLQKYKNTLVMILEDFGGESLKILMSLKKLTLEEFLIIAIKITEILQKIHATNIIHKEIIPNNIIYNSETQVIKIIDFGISTVLNHENPTIKKPNILEGTLAYMSPEQTGRMNRSLDYRTDFYSLGVTFYELLTHQLPFDASEALELIHCHIAKPPVPPAQIDPEIPKAVSDIVMKLLAKRAEDRYQSAWGIQADLHSCLTQLQTRSQILELTLGHQDIYNKFQIPQKLYGRKPEIQTLLAAFERVRSGTTEIMLVSGYSGIGKSALVQEIYKPITREKGYFISGKFDQFQRNIPYSAVVNAFQSLIRQLLTESEAALSQWQEKLLAAFGFNGQIIIDVIPEVELIVGPQPPVQDLRPTESQNRFNSVFQNFIRVFCSPSHPLVIFLDDLQWADSATLKLIEVMMIDEKMRYLFVIGAYRDNEVDSTHPLMMSLKTLRQEKAIINQITLVPLKLKHIARLIAETLQIDTESVEPLASLVVRKTQGNAFFVNQFLKTLYAENLLIFNYPSNLESQTPNQDSEIVPDTSKVQVNKWQWNITQIEAMGITENVVELMLGKLKKLPNATQMVLQLAACVGNKFDLYTLAIIHEKSTADTFQDILPAIQAGLILPTSDFKTTSSEIITSQLVIFNYKFLHDRVQQSAYALIEEKLQKAVQLQIGQLLLANLSPEQRAERIFELVDHLNIGRELLTDDYKKLELATLNLAAGKKAKDAIAYAAGVQYLTAGLESLPGEIWTDHYDLAFALYKELAEVEYLNGNFEQSEALIDIMLSQAKSAIEKAEVYNMLIVQYTLLTKYQEAINVGLKALTLLGINLPEEPEALQNALTIEFAIAKANLVDKEIAALIDAEEMKVPEQKIIVKLLGHMGPLTFFSHQELWKMTVVKAINLSLQHGFISGGSYCYSCYGIILSAILKDYQSGYEFGLLALKLSENANNLSQNCQDSVIFANYLNCWVKHIKLTNIINNEGYKVGLQSGNLQWAGYNRMFQTITLFYQGVNLEQLLQDISNFLLFCERTRNQWATDIIVANKLATLSLRNKNYNLNEVQYIEEFKNHKSMAALCEFYVLKSQTMYLYDQPEEAYKWAILALEILNFLMGHISSSHHNFYYSLILTALYPSASVIDKASFKEILIANQKQMKIWANQCPENFLHKYLLVEAEIARISGEVQEAMDLYDCAIESAREHEFTQNEALANELAAKFWLARGKEEFAKLYLTKAHYSYQLWGAFGKVEDLEEKYPHLLKKTRDFGKDITSSGTNDLDLITVIKASQALSSEIVLSSLLDKLMKIVIENAGAQIGLFITKQNDVWVIEVEGTVDTENKTVLQPLICDVNQTLPMSIINYVERTRENLVIDEANCDQRFITDPYIVFKQPKSILCSPIIYQGKLTGILYLENNLTTAAFTPERLKILNLLTAQVSISLENAKLYSNLQNYSKELNIKNIELLETNRKLEVEIAERQQAELALRESEERLKAIINNSTAVIYVKDTQGRYILINHQLATQFHIEAWEVKGKTDYDFLPNEMADVVLANDRQVLISGNSLEFEEVILQDDGLHTYISIKVPLYDTEGVIYAVCGISTDITDRKRVEAQIRQFNEALETQVAERTAQLESANKELDAFSYSVSHDLRAPLRHISGFVNVLTLQLERNGAIAEPKVAHYLKVIQDSGQKMGQLIDGLLTLSRLGRRQLEKNPINLYPLVETAIALVKSQIAETDRRIEFEVGELPTVMGDASLLQQVFSNLIDNAVKFSRNRSPAKIAIGTLQDRTVFVRDNGVGFDMEYADQLFGVFQRLHSEKAFEGTGIGLAIVQRIIHRHGGEIWAESKLDQGTTFYFKLEQILKE